MYRGARLVDGKGNWCPNGEKVKMKMRTTLFLRRLEKSLRISTASSVLVALVLFPEARAVIDNIFDVNKDLAFGAILTVFFCTGHLGSSIRRILGGLVGIVLPIVTFWAGVRLFESNAVTTMFCVVTSWLIVYLPFEVDTHRFFLGAYF